ncbi:unnamed protein product [Microthlaspi erraticum]|uniref:F-box domain-containing protein n=1 Tax=Microthlaspi erraticum TaxID=1685480 RepID=A0A6D2KBI1_9BRAS|nr:unnamed protein product [Microthlaspi erraticum]CAA7050424.1 unnamed protein product [Microthlaspi erraticum]
MAVEVSADLVEEILSWVPAKSLPRMKSICKTWETLIAERSFVNKHLSHMRSREQQFTVFNNVSSSQVSSSLISTVASLGIDFNELEEPNLNLQIIEPLASTNILVQSMHHCDGLLLFVLQTNLLLLNPFLKQARSIKCGNGFDHSVDAYGIGYISNQSTSFKMVRFRCGASDDDKDRSRIKVYDFESDRWRVVADKSFDDFSEFPESSVCLKGTPFWRGYLNGKTFSTIQSFDFSKERFETLFLPPSTIGSSTLGNSLSLGVFRGEKLSLLHRSRLEGKVHLWVMKKHWSKVMTVALPESAMSPRYASYFIDSNGKLVLSIREINSIKIYILGKDVECQNVEYSHVNPSVGGSGCYYVPSLLQVPGFSRR